MTTLAPSFIRTCTAFNTVRTYPFECGDNTCTTSARTCDNRTYRFFVLPAPREVRCICASGSEEKEIVSLRDDYIPEIVSMFDRLPSGTKCNVTSQAGTLWEYVSYDPTDRTLSFRCGYSMTNMLVWTAFAMNMKVLSATGIPLDEEFGYRPKRSRR